MRQAEEVERDILLKSLRGSEERSMKAQRLESGALRRMRYVHWAAAQLLCVGPVLPLHEARTPRASLLTAALLPSTRARACLPLACDLRFAPCALLLPPCPLLACYSA